MVIYVDEQKAGQWLSSIPAALRGRAMEEHRQMIRDRGIGLTEGDGMARLTFPMGATPQDIHELLQEINVAAVDLEPEDIQHYGGRSPITFAASRKLQNGDFGTHVKRLRPEEINDVMVEVISSAFEHTKLTVEDVVNAGAKESLALAELAAAGYELPPDPWATQTAELSREEEFQKMLNDGSLEGPKTLSRDPWEF